MGADQSKSRFSKGKASAKATVKATVKAATSNSSQQTKNMAATTTESPQVPITTPKEPLTGAARGKEILTELSNANKNFMNDDFPSQTDISSSPIRVGLLQGQSPDVCVIACSDSRVAPEILYCAGLGKVFVIRNAGNVVWGDSNIGSIEYAVGVLKVPLVMVMGHTKCGAVTAAAQAVGQNSSGTTPLARHVEHISEVIKPTADKHDGTDTPQDELVKDCILHNIKQNVQDLKNGDHGVSEAFKKGDVEIVGALYDMATGEVCVIDQE